MNPLHLVKFDAILLIMKYLALSMTILFMMRSKIDGTEENKFQPYLVLFRFSVP